ncbi:MAG: poly-beta,6-N-acetyl-D-glucosamine biosynthesis protein PgaD [Burkholderia sp.]|nr:poly-beta,6-N-acetyl-D-glucosamine biosynthesis protein PgaD [Burkholderia sp.]
MKLIYDQDVACTLPTRLGRTLLTALLWALWLWLLAPLLPMTSWSPDPVIADNSLLFPSALTVVESEGIVFFLIGSVSISGSGLLVWSGLNYLRFRKARRRTRRLPAQLQELADHSALLTEEVSAWQKARRVMVYHDEHGKVLDAEILHHIEPAREMQEVK